MEKSAKSFFVRHSCCEGGLIKQISGSDENHIKTFYITYSKPAPGAAKKIVGTNKPWKNTSIGTLHKN